MARAGALGEVILWRVLSRSHLFLLALAPVALVVEILRTASVLSTMAENAAANVGAITYLHWTAPAEWLSWSAIYIVFAGCCYLLREILRFAAASTPHTPAAAFFAEFHESEVEMILNKWLEKVLMALVIVFVVLAIIDFVASWQGVYRAVNYSWATKLASSIKTAAPKLFYATILFFLSKLMMVLRARGSEIQ